MIERLNVALTALKKASDVFYHYGDLHAAKPDMEKASRNYDLAWEMLDAATRATEGLND